MVNARQCDRCGTVLSAHALGGLCPKCLLGAVALGARPAESGGEEAEGVRAELAGSEAVASEIANRKSPIPNHFGDYELLEEIARGGMGVVYRARQKSLGRTVAVKLMLAEHLATPQQVARFRAEAQAAAALRHPNIVAIHEVGEQDGQHFFSMDYIEGRNLARAMADVGFRSSGFPRCARWMKAVAEAVHYAHQQGIIHRDLKPSNILIDAHDQPHITDFGLAKRLTDPQLSTLNPQLTLTGQVLGSPNYLPPEQAEGKSAQVGPPSDVYSLGAILYHLLTGRPPFQAESLTTVLKQVVEADPVAPRALNPSIPRDLETICLKCLEKEAPRRYPTAQALADDLGRFLDAEPILARPSGAWDRAVKWARRKPAIAALIATVAIVTAIGLNTSLWYARDARQKLQQAKLAEARAGDNAYAAEMNLAFSALEENNLGRVAQLLERHRPKPGEPDRRGWEWRYLRKQCQSDELATLGRHDHYVAAVAFSPDGKWLASGGFDGLIKVWEVHSRRLVTNLVHKDRVRAVAFSPDGRWLATGAAGPSDTLVLWATTNWQRSLALPAPTEVRGLAFSPDGQRLAWMDNASVTLWDLRTQHTVSRWPGSSSAQGQPRLAFSSDGRLLAWVVTPVDPAIYTNAYLVDLWSGAAPVTFRVRDTVFCVGLSPDGHRLAVGEWGGWILLWDLAKKGTPLPPLTNHTGWVTSLAFTADGKRLASASADQRIILWDTTAWQPEFTLKGQRGEIWASAMSPDGHLLATGGKEDRAVRLWRAVPPPTERQELRAEAGHVHPSGRICFLGWLDASGAVTNAELRDLATLAVVTPNLGYLRPQT